LGHTVPPVELGDGTAYCEHRERCVGVVPRKEPHFPPYVQRTVCWEVELRINSTPRSDEDVHNTESHRFRT
jgi:hypothetical protein